MKITSVRATAVEVPVTRVAAYAKRVITHVTNTIVEVETDAGISGLGEARGTFCARLINERFAPAVKGLPVADRRSVRDACLPKEPFDYGYPEHLAERNAFAGIEIALWDLAGKAAGEPLYRLLGGPVRERAPFVAYAYTVDPAEGRPAGEIAAIMADIAADRVEASGARMFEFKVGLHSAACEIGVVQAVRDAVGPEVDLAVDANMGFSVEQAPPVPRRHRGAPPRQHRGAGGRSRPDGAPARRARRAGVHPLLRSRRPVAPSRHSIPW